MSSKKNLTRGSLGTYSRRLRRYEGEPIAVAHDAGEGQAGMDFFSPFGPMIARFQAPVELVDQLNRKVPESIENEAEEEEKT